MNNIFRKFAANVAKIVGSPWAFTTALALIVVWLLLGPEFGFSNSWAIAINTLSTVVTFLIVFIIQNTQNRHSKAIQLKLDELIRSMHAASNQLLDIEEVSDEELDELKNQFHSLHLKYESELEKRKRTKKPQLN